MSYQVIARKWRPQSFTDLKGQSTTRRTLTNAVKNKRLHHALLFTGPRGTGKTSTARIVAKILRCENLQKDFNPCNKCRSCEEVAEGRSLDVLEIDGASNNGVDSVRELRDQVSFNPTSGKNKIYIIDEVHMLSGSAFNALLKTLEEPPENVYFIMATTEVHKLPKTILSRCQKYDFKPVPQIEVLNLLKEVAQAENITYDEEALFLIAQAGEGCVRDSLSFLDQCITFSEGKITKEAVVENLGVTDISHFKKLLEALLARDSRALVEELKSFKDFNADPQVYLEDLVKHIKNLILFKVDGDYLQKEENFSEVEKKIYTDFSKRARLEDLYILFDICFKGSLDLARSFDPLVLLEVTLLKAGTSPFYKDLTGTPPVEEASLPRKTSPPLRQEPPQREQDKSWKSFVAKVKSLNPVIGTKLDLCGYHYEKEKKKLVLSPSAKASFMVEQLQEPEFLKAIKNYIKSFWGEEVEVFFESKQSEEHKPSLQEERQTESSQKLEEMKKKIENLDVIKSMKQKYKVEIKEIKELRK